MKKFNRFEESDGIDSNYFICGEDIFWYQILQDLLTDLNNNNNNGKYLSRNTSSLYVTVKSWDSPKIPENLVNVVVCPEKINNLIACEKKTALFSSPARVMAKTIPQTIPDPVMCLSRSVFEKTITTDCNPSCKITEPNNYSYIQMRYIKINL